MMNFAETVARDKGFKKNGDARPQKQPLGFMKNSGYSVVVMSSPK